MKLADLIRGNDRGALSLRVVLATALVSASAGLGGVAFTSPASAGHGPLLAKVTVCHALPGNNPYEALDVDASSVSNLPNGHDSHTGDVIPPYHYLDGNPPTEQSYEGLNWDAAGQAVHANGCKPATDLSVTKTGPDTARINTSGAYVLSVVNGGPTAYAPITLVDTVPDGWNVGAVVPGAGSGFTCGTDRRVLTCTTSTDLARATATSSPLKVTVNVTYASLGEKTNSVRLSSAADTNTANNTATKSTDVVAPDLELDKTGPVKVTVGDSGSYELTVTNVGPIDTVGAITVVDALPLGVTVEDGLPGGCSSGNGRTITCTTSEVLGSKEYVDFTIPVTFDVVGETTNTATVSGGGQVETDNDTDTWTTAVAGIPDLVLSKTGPVSAVVGTTGQYVLTARNSGSGPTSGTITVVDTLPLGVTPSTATGCTGPVGRLVTCTSTTALDPGETVSWTLPATFTSVGSLTNEAAVSGGGQRNTSNDGASADTDVTATPVADLTLTKTGPGTATKGDTGEYVMTVRNQGTGDTTGTITVTDTLPAGVTATAPGSGCALDGRVVTCTSAAVLSAGSTVAFTVPVAFTGSGTVVNTAVVSGGGQTNTANDTAETSTVVAGVADLTIAKTGTPATVVAGGTVTYLLTATNAGDAAAAGVVISDTLEAEQLLVSATGSSPALTCTGTVTVVCSLSGTLAAGASVVATVVAQVPASTVASSVSNTATVTPTDGGATNTSTVTTAVQALTPTVRITKANDADRNGRYTLDETVETAGADVPFKATITNDSPYALVVSSLSYADSEERPALRAKGSLRAAAAGGVTCVPSLGSIPVGGTADCLFTLPAYSPAAGGARRGLVTVAAHQAGNPANATAVSGTSVVRTVVPQQTPAPASTPTTPPTTPPPTTPPAPLTADLSLDKSGPAVASPGDTLKWRLAVLNKGPGVASGFTVVDTLPADVTLTSISGDGFSCTGASCTATTSLPAGATAVLEVVGVLSSGSSATALANTAAVTPTDASADNSDTLVTSVTQPGAPGQADLVLDKAGPLEAVKPGDVLTYGISVQNVGTAPATGFVVTDELPEGLTLVSVAGPGFTCDGEGVSCTYTEQLRTGETAQLAVVTRLVDGYASNGVANTATVALQGDPTGDNNTDTATTAVSLPIGGVGDPDPATGGEDPAPAPEETPSTLPFTDDDEGDDITGGGGGTAQEQTPRALPFTGAPAGLLLAVGAGLSSLGLMLALVGRRRRSVV